LTSCWTGGDNAARLFRRFVDVLLRERTMTTPGIAIILFTVNKEAKQDVPGTLKRVRECGFKHVQWSGMPPMEAPDIRKALEDADLTPVAAHCPMEPFEEDFAGQVRFWRTVGVRDVAPGGMMRDCQEDLEGWFRGAKRLEVIGEKLRNEDMRLSYHNHAWELEKFEGDNRRKLDILYESTAPENLCAELDTAWLYAGGQDPAAYIRKYKGRCPVIHAKDMKEERGENGRPVFTPVGQGVLDWGAIIAAAKDSGVEWLVYEQDSCEGDVFDAVRESYRFLNENV
jgi:sugar phosphate isomerase/epimerase